MIKIRKKAKRKEKKFLFQPFSIKQKKLMFFWCNGSPHQEKEIVIADGAIRSGKTISMITSFVRWSLSCFDGENFIIAGKTIGSLKKNVISPLLQILRSWNMDYYYNRSENFLIIGNNTYYMYDASNEASQDRLQGLTAAGALADEVALFPRSFVDQMVGRCSVEGSKIFMNCNPGGPFHFMKTEFINKVKEKRIMYLHFVMEDNLSLSPRVRERYYRMFSGIFYKRYILGLWVQAEGVIYDMFSEEEHRVDNKPREYIKYQVSCDYGTQNATTFLLWGLNKEDSKWYAISEYYYSGRDKGVQKTDEQYYQDLENMLGSIMPEYIVIDPSAASFIALIKQKGKYRIKKAKNDVLEGIRNVSTALANKAILFTDDCVNTFKEFTSYVWDEKAAIKRGEDKPLKVSDHAMDAIRYFVNTILMGNNKVKATQAI